MPGQSNVTLSLENTIKWFAMGENVFCTGCDNIIHYAIYINAYNLHMQIFGFQAVPAINTARFFSTAESFLQRVRCWNSSGDPLTPNCQGCGSAYGLPVTKTTSFVGAAAASSNTHTASPAWKTFAAMGETTTQICLPFCIFSQNGAIGRLCFLPGKRRWWDSHSRRESHRNQGKEKRLLKLGLQGFWLSPVGQPIPLCMPPIGVLL